MLTESTFIKQGENAMPETPVELINQTIEKVENILKTHYPDYLNFGNGSFTISYGSTQVMIIIRPFTSEDTSVECISNVVSGAMISNELMNFLLRKNAELHIGGFGLLFDDTVIYQHSIAGSNIDANELLTSIKAVAIISDHYDDEIVAMAGGKRAADLEFGDL